jgi:hypothetical protein
MMMIFIIKKENYTIYAKYTIYYNIYLSLLFIHIDLDVLLRSQCIIIRALLRSRLLLSGRFILLSGRFCLLRCRFILLSGRFCLLGSLRLLDRLFRLRFRLRLFRTIFRRLFIVELVSEILPIHIFSRLLQLSPKGTASPPLFSLGEVGEVFGLMSSEQLPSGILRRFLDLVLSVFDRGFDLFSILVEVLVDDGMNILWESKFEIINKLTDGAGLKVEDMLIELDNRIHVLIDMFF